LSSDYNVKLLIKIKEVFTYFEQQMFLSSVYCYLNYHPTNDFVIDLDKVWKWMGFSQKSKAKHLMEKHFVLDRDYNQSLSQLSKQTPQERGGHNKEIFMLNIKTFKLFCIKSDTKKADEIHDYFLKMETIIQEVINDENNELKKQLTVQSEQIEIQNEQIKNSK